MHNIQLEDTVDIDNLLLEGVDTRAAVETDLLIEADESNYSVLRDIRRGQRVGTKQQ